VPFQAGWAAFSNLGYSVFGVGLPDAFCKNTGQFVHSCRSNLCRNS